MTATARPADYSYPAGIPASVEILTEFLRYYGFDYFLTRTLGMIDLNDEQYSDAVDEAITLYREDADLNTFSLSRAFRSVVDELIEDGHTRSEAYEILAEEDYVVPVSVAMYYSVDSGDSDIESLSALIRNRAHRLLRQQQRAGDA